MIESKKNSGLVWTADDVIRAVRGKTADDQRWQAHGVSIDSRTVQPGDLFIALKGPLNDGHDYVSAALAAGAAAAIVSQPPADVSEEAPLVTVKDTMTALEDLGRAGRQRSQAKIIGVTGSVGKTGSKEMLRLMLSAAGETYANEGSFNNHWGAPLSLARLPASAKFGVFELGMNHAGELAPLSGMVQPHIAMIINVEAVHLEYFASIEAIADAKAEIFLGTDKNGTAILNRDNSQFAKLEKAARARGITKILGFGIDEKSDAKLIECRPSGDGSDVTAEIGGVSLQYHIGTPGEHLALNSLGALLAVNAAGGNMSICAAALSQFKPPKGRGVAQRIPFANGAITLIDESYNASPVAVRASIRVLSQKQPESGGRRLLALGDMRELGDTSPALHAALANDIAEAGIDRVYSCGEMMAYLYEALPPALRGFHADNSAELADRIASDLHEGDVVTVKGSNAIRMSLVVDAIKNLGTAGITKNGKAKKKARRLMAAVLMLCSFVLPAKANEYDLPSRSWSTTDERPLGKYPPSLTETEKLINHALDTDWNIPVCSFKFIDVYDGQFRLLASLDVNGRHKCNRMIVVSKQDNTYHLDNDWKVIAAENVSDLLHDIDNDKSPEIVMTEPWSHEETGKCQATWNTIYKWRRERFEDSSFMFPDYYRNRRSDLQLSVAHDADPSCHLMEIDKISRLLGAPKAEFNQAVDWMKNADPTLRRKAAALFNDVNDAESKKNLAVLATDSDALTAESAKMFIESAQKK